MMHGPQNIKDINVNREDCYLRHLYPLSLLFEYVFVCVCVCVCMCARARARARITSGSILCSSFNYASQGCESTGAFLSR
jgi:hypothetical protein